MVKKIRWTTASIIDRTKIYKYWMERNQSDVYPEKLEYLFVKSAEMISNFPKIGNKTKYRNVFSKVIRSYNIFYRIEGDEVQVLRVWDTRQNPDKKIL